MCRPRWSSELLAAYGSARRAATPGFDLADFARAYAILGAQRNTKIAGIFARLDKRDGRPSYLKHRTCARASKAYLRRSLDHPALSRRAKGLAIRRAMPENCSRWGDLHVMLCRRCGEHLRLEHSPSTRKTWMVQDKPDHDALSMAHGPAA